MSIDKESMEIFYKIKIKFYNIPEPTKKKIKKFIDKQIKKLVNKDIQQTENQ